MSDQPKRVSILTPDGKFDTIGAEFADEVVRAGGRVLTKKEAEDKAADVAKQAAQAREDARYEKSGTAGKVLGAVSTVASAMTPGSALTFGAGAAPGTAPAAYSTGAVEGLTGGLSSGLTRQAIDATLGHDVGDRYAQQVQDQRTANPIAHGAGNLVGTTAGLVSGAGEIAEQGAARALAKAGIQGTTTLGKAGVAAAKLGTRGLVEGAAIGAGDYAGEQLLADKDIATDKLVSHGLMGGLAGGLVGGGLGAGGSLAKSGLSRLVSREATDIAAPVERQLPEALSRDATTEEALAARKAWDAAEAPTGKVNSFIKDPTEGGKRLANDLAFDALGATKVQMRKALENVAADQAVAKTEVGGYVNRVLREHVGENASAWQVGKVGRADDLLELIKADKAGRIATNLSDAVKGTPARVDMNAIYAKAWQEANNMTRDPVRAAGADAFWNRVSREMDALKLSGKVSPTDGTIDAADAFYLRSQLAKNAYEVSKISGHAGDSYKAFLRDLDGETIRAIDDASAKAGKNGVGENIRHWKREWQLASAAEQAAEGGAERYAGNNAFGIREGIAGATAIMTGHPILGTVGPIAMKVAKERGKAVLAQKLFAAAERGTLAKFVAQTDAQITKASKGLIALPEKGAAKGAETMPPPRQLATKALARVAAFQADPDDYVDRASQQTESIATHSPEIASELVSRQVQAMTFLSSKVPTQGNPDPLDPHPRIHMTPSEEASFARYAWYTEKPGRFFAEVAHGKLVPEGAETAQALMPRAFEQLQQETLDALTTQLARGNRIPFRQRELLGQLLDFAATPAQRPEHRTFLQQNVSDVLPSDLPLSSAAPAKPRRVTTTPSESPLDRLEARGPGHR